MNDTNELKQVEVRLKLIDAPGILTTEPMNNAERAVEAMRDLMAELSRECICVVNLDSKCHPINYNVVSVGSINNSIASPAEVFKSALLSNAANIIVLHNHPSGDPTPSADDRRVTERLCVCGEFLGVPLLDHIIIGSGSHRIFSFREKNPELFQQSVNYDFMKRLVAEGGAEKSEEEELEL